MFWITVFALFLSCGTQTDFYTSTSSINPEIGPPRGTKPLKKSPPCRGKACRKKAKKSNRKKPVKGPDFFEEHFTIVDKKSLEILLVVDTSSSMDKNLKKMGQNLSSLLSHISDKKWRMAFTSADHGDHFTKATSPLWRQYRGELPKYGKFMFLEKGGEVLKQKILYSHTSGVAQIFEDTLTRKSPRECSLPPYCQSYNEQPLRSLKAALQRAATDRVHKEFFQKQTDTVVIIITDEDERRADPENATRAEEVMETYNQVFKGHGKRLFGFTISVQDQKCYDKESKGPWFLKTQGVAFGRIIARLPELTGGKNISLCSKYGPALTSLSHVSRKLMHSLTLQKLLYIPDTVQVKLKPSQPRVSYRLEGKNIVFSDDILVGTEVRVRYRYEQ